MPGADRTELTVLSVELEAAEEVTEVSITEDECEVGDADAARALKGEGEEAERKTLSGLESTSAVESA